MPKRLVSGIIISLMLSNALTLALENESEYLGRVFGNSSGELAQVWDTRWGGSQTDYCCAIGTDGIDLYVTGYTWSFGAGNSDVFLLKVDEEGNVLWARTWGTNDHERAFSLCVTDDAVYVAAMVGGELLKFSKTGDLIYSKTVEVDSEPSGFTNVEAAGDQLYVGIGYGFLAKLTETANSLQVDWAETAPFEPTIIRIHGDSLYVAYKDGVGIASFNKDGHISWEKVLGNGIRDFAVSSDGIFVVCYRLIYKLSLDGDLIWAKTIDQKVDCSGICVTASYLYLTGNADDTIGGGGLLMVLTKNGEVVSSYSYRGSTHDGLAGLVIADGEMYCTGSTLSSERSLAPFSCSLTPTDLTVETPPPSINPVEIIIESIEGVVTSPSPHQTGVVNGYMNGFIASFSLLEPPRPSYPADNWERIWYVNSGNGQFGSYLGLGPQEPNPVFSNDWGVGTVAYGRADLIGFVSSRTIHLDAGTWKFTVDSDDGFRLYIDDVLVLDKWLTGPKTYSVERSFSSDDNHRFRLEWFEDWGSARISFSVARVFSPVTDGFRFSNTAFNNKMKKQIEEIAAEFESSDAAQELPSWSWSLFERVVQAACWAQMGYCGGMVYTADYYFDHPEEFRALGYSCVHDIDIGDQVTNSRIIYNQWITQLLGDSHLLRFLLMRLGNDPGGLLPFDEEVNWILGELDKGNTVRLSVFDPSWSSGREWFMAHAVLAYKYVRDGTDIDIYVYGPNFGNMAHRYYDTRNGKTYVTEKDGGQRIRLTKNAGGSYTIVDWKDPTYKVAYIESFAITRLGSDEAPILTLTWSSILSHFGEILEQVEKFLAEEGVKLLSVKAESPVNLLVATQEWLRVGYDPDTCAVVNDIGGAMYSGNGTEPQMVLIPYSQGENYTINAFGTGSGSYRITVESTNSEGNTVGTLTYTGFASQGSFNMYTIELQADGIIIPEFPSILSPLLLVMITLSVVFVCKTKKHKAIIRSRQRSMVD